MFIVVGLAVLGLLGWLLVLLIRRGGELIHVLGIPHFRHERPGTKPPSVVRHASHRGYRIPAMITVR